MSTNKVFRKNVLRMFLNENRTSMEKDVDELIYELMKLKRRIGRSNKDTHYDVQKLINDLKLTIQLTGKSILLDWESDLEGYLYLFGLSNEPPTVVKGSTPTTLDSF